MTYVDPLSRFKKLNPSTNLDNQQVQNKKPNFEMKLFGYNEFDLPSNMLFVNTFFSASPPEVQEVANFLYLFANEEMISDEALLMEFEYIKDKGLDVAEILRFFKIGTKGLGLLNLIDKRNEISDSTKQKYRKYFKEKLEQKYNFDPKYTDKSNKTKFNYGDYKYTSPTYSVKQKNDNILEVVNKDTKEKRIIDFEKIISEKFNGIDDVISLKSSIQKLPADLLFQIPEEVSIMYKPSANIYGNDDKYYREDGSIQYFGLHDNEVFATNADPDTIIHTLAHAIFIDKAGNEVLYNNKELVEIFNAGAKKYRQENDYFADKDGYSKTGYWSENLPELGAEIISAVYTNDTEILDSINKYAPGAIPIVLDIYKQRLNADDKHTKFTVDELIKDSGLNIEE